MRLLLIDNSNTCTKFAVSDDTAGFSDTIRLPTAEITVESLGETLAALAFDAVALCSVVPAVATIVRGAVPHPLHEISHHSDLPIGIDYPAPEQIGADRLANAVAVHSMRPAPAIVIDFGTAVTFDVVGKPGRYLGGVIAPGLASLTEYLADHTALLPRIDLAEPATAIGKSTTEAMRAGAVIGYRGMIREILSSISGELDGIPSVVATGGDAALIVGGLPEIEEVVPDLTLRGIDLIGRRHLST